ncbi:hypothetical protein FRC10_002212 [Ceratobasidium sp. 414]|nr:hypothetical protein FRC10_002212 [Ceratobasidium sp. 414]
MDFNDHPTSLTLTLALQGKVKPTSEQELSSPSQGSQNSLTVLVDPLELESPTPPLCTPSPSICIDDAMSDVSGLSPYTPLMSMPPTPDTPQQILAREYDSPSGLSPSTSMLSFDPSMQSPSACVPRILPNYHENPSAKGGYRAKAKGLQFQVPTRSLGSGSVLLSPVNAVRQQDVYPLPSPMARDLRRRIEADDGDTEVDIATYGEDNCCPDTVDTSNIGVEHQPTQTESSCLGLDLGLPASNPDETTPCLGPSERSGRRLREGDENSRELGMGEFGAQIMHGMLAHSASAELVSSSKKSHDRPLDSTQTRKDSPKPPGRTAPKASIPLPDPHLKSPFSSTPLAKQGSTAYTLAALPLPSTPSKTGDTNLKHDIRKSNSRVGPPGRLLGAGSPSPSPKRNYASRNTISLMQLRMHGHARFPQHFPEGHLLVAKFAQIYCLETELGAGGYGFVLGARNMMTGEEVAVKFITRSSVLARGLVRDHKNDIVPLEAVVLRLAQHPGVVQFRGLYEDDLYFYLVQELHGSPWSKNSKNQHKLDQGPDSLEDEAQAQHESKPSSPVSPYAPTQSSPLRHCMPSMPAPAAPTLGHPTPQEEGSRLLLPLHARPQAPRRASYDLFECIEQHERLSEGQAKHIFAQVVDTVKYLDSIGITHRDIKDENLVIDKDFKVKMIDFGSAVIRDVRKPPPTYTCFFGTVTFASPEILKDLPYTAPPAEVWALGILLSFLVTGQSPFPTREHAMYGVMCEPNASIAVSPLCGDLIKKCLEPDPARRLTVYQVREHLWLRGALDRA